MVKMISPFALPPHPLAQAAAAEVMDSVHAYMHSHPESELHKHGKMFGVLVLDGTDEDALVHCASSRCASPYLAAFSAKLDGSYSHEGFVPPVYEMREPPVGTGRAESQRLQRLLFAEYRLLNGRGETKNLLDIFADEKPVIPPEQWFDKSQDRTSPHPSLPPSGAGECCAPKLLQYAFAHGMKPLALAEFWVGASPKTEIRREGVFYAPCSGRCVPVLRHMLRGVDVEAEPQKTEAEELCRQMKILFEDEYLLVVNKPAGLLSVPGKSGEISAAEYLAARPAHRLDQDTSGLLVLAKTPEVYTALQTCFQRRDILKRYEAVVCPHPSFSPKAAESSAVISLPLLPNPYDRPRQMVSHEHGKPALTRYVIRERRDDGTCLVDLYPLTGRTHQLRVHAAHPDGLNAPVAGDRLYGSALSAPRLMLHAAELAFVHPVTKKEMHFCIPSGF